MTSKIRRVENHSDHKDAQDEDIKIYAEKAMNELLGWYGYDNFSDNKTIGKPKKCMKQKTVESKKHRKHNNQHDRFPSDESTQESSEGFSSQSAALNLSSHGNLKIDSSSDAESEVKCPQNGGSDLPDPNSVRIVDPEKSSRSCQECSWCQITGRDFFRMETPDGEKAFCSDICFARCRRASFKINKICDWCKNVRHTINYVDFQDGEQQLQFCSDQCLSQYKMHIFYKETEAHLHMIPSIDSGNQSTQALITPELWLKKKQCKQTNNIWSREKNETEVHLANPLTGGLEPASTVTRVSENLKKKIARELSEIRDDDSSAYHYSKFKGLKGRSQRHWAKTHKYKKFRKKISREFAESKQTSSRTPICSSSCNSSSTSSSNSGCESCSASVLSQDKTVNLKLIKTESSLGLSDQVLNSSKTCPSEDDIHSWLLKFSRMNQTQPGLPYSNGTSRLSNSLVPPPMILVPYPVAIPLPIPIPIPLPLIIPLDNPAYSSSKVKDLPNHNKRSSDKSVESVISRLWTLSKALKEQSATMPEKNLEDEKEDDNDMIT